MSTLLIKFWPLVVVLLLVFIWFVSSRRKKNVKIDYMKTWVMTLGTVIVVVIIGIIISFTMENDDESYEPIGHRGADGMNAIQPRIFEADNAPTDIP